MENYGKCKDCRYCDPSERSSYKWYCEWYGRYEDPDEVRDCPHYKDN